MGVRYVLTFIGAVGTLSVMFAAGRDLARWTPTPTSRLAVTVAGAVIAVVRIMVAGIPLIP
jgi:hypothetical protein